jgi:acetylornithine/succinyldiaminopimelate/putrescine aminotransferase
MQISQRQLFLQHVAQTSPAPLLLEIERAEGNYLYDIQGKKYLDLISGISVSNIGHRHPSVLAAIHAQLDKYMHLMVYGEYVQSPQVKLASRLSEVIPGFESFYFVNSGTEATEGAIKLARRFTGRKKLLSFKNAYHGSTTGALSLMSDPYFRGPFEPLLQDTAFLEPEDYKSLDNITEETAAVFFEFIRAEVGAIPVSREFAIALRQRCTEKGALLIADEIQTGFGRTGKLFSFQDYECMPDILLMAKGMGGGMPIGAFAARKEIMSSLTHDPVLGHITTFGGHPVSCAASLATLETILLMNPEKQAAEIETIFRKKLVHRCIEGISGKGLLLAADLRTESVNQKVIASCIRKGLITDWFLFAPHKLRIAPPLTLTTDEANRACDIILEACNEV